MAESKIKSELSKYTSNSSLNKKITQVIYNQFKSKIEHFEISEYDEISFNIIDSLIEKWIPLIQKNDKVLKNSVDKLSEMEDWDLYPEHFLEIKKQNDNLMSDIKRVFDKDKTCSKCKKKMIIMVREIQSRSGDEKATVEWECQNCGHSFKT